MQITFLPHIELPRVIAGLFDTIYRNSFLIVEVDEFYLGGECSGKRGRGAGHKHAVAIAVERNGRKLGRLRLHPIDSRGGRDLTAFVQAHIAPDNHIQTDAWSG
jgi:hypothetical protein